MRMKNGAWLLVLLLTSALGRGQSQTKPTKVERRALTKLEDSVADQFAAIRKSSGLRPLSRIKNRSQLRKLVCTAAINGKGFDKWGAIYYETSDLSTPDTRLEQLAKFDAPQQKAPTVITDAAVNAYRTGGMPDIERFSVAVWPSKTRNAYWVGIGLYWGATWEWVDLHLTDDMYYRNEWKKSIAPECGGKNRPSTTGATLRPKRRVQLCLERVTNSSSAPDRSNLDALASSLTKLSSEQPSKIYLETRTVNGPSVGAVTSKDANEGCDYMLKFENEELTDGCSVVASNTTRCRDRQRHDSPTRYSVEFWIYRSGKSEAILHKTLTQIYSGDAIISDEVGIGNPSMVSSIRTAIQNVITQSKRPGEQE